MHTRFSFLLVFVLVLTVFPMSPASADGPIPIDEIHEDTTLTEDHMGGIALKENDITLDCDGHSIIENHESDEGIGILIEGLTGVAVKDCNVSGFLTGVHLSGVSNSVISNTTSMAVETGFLIGRNGSGSHDNLLVGNVASGAEYEGFVIESSYDNIFRHNAAYDNGVYGFSLEGGAHGNLLDGNSAAGSLGVWYATGFQLVSSSGNTLVGNHATRNALSGFMVELGSDGNTLTGNKSYKNDRFGFMVQWDSGDNTLKRNIATSNGSDGIGIFEAAPGNEFVRNRANSNGRFGLQIWDTSEALVANNVLNANGWFDPSVYAAGLYVQSANHNAFTGNTTNGNLMNGIRVVDGSAGNEFTDNTACGNRDVDVSSEAGLVNVWAPDNHFCSSFEPFVVETLTVPATAPLGVDSSALASGTDYQFKVTGTWTNRGGMDIVDAECVDTNNAGWVQGVEAPYPPELLNLQVDETTVDWIPLNAVNAGGCDDRHEYTFGLTGANSAVNFRIYDGSGNDQIPGWFGDNSGSLTVEVWQSAP